MTPFGARLRQLRAERGINLKDMAKALRCSSAYLSALEHGHRGKPNWAMVQAIINYFNIIWDDAEELQHLADISHPRVTIDTSGLSADATLLANRLARSISQLDSEALGSLLHLLKNEMEAGRSRLTHQKTSHDREGAKTM
jgi:transcriptional regulator with XRE-family HTH domain